EAKIFFPSGIYGQHVPIDQRPNRAQRARLYDVDTGRLGRLTFGNNSLDQRFGYTFEVLDLDSRVLLIQDGLHFLIDDRVCRPPDNDASFLLCGGIQLSDSVTARALAL